EFPDGWVAHSVADQAADTVSATPDPSSGNWILVVRVPSSQAGAEGLTEETFAPRTTYQADAAGGHVITGPLSVTVAGIHGIEMHVAGFVGDRTGEPLESRLVGLFGASASYLLQVQYDEAGRSEMLQAWEAMLTTLMVSDVGAVDVPLEFEQLVRTDFAAGVADPFETGRNSRMALSIVDGAYRFERLADGTGASLGPFPVPVLSVTIVAGVEHSTQGAADAVGVGCINNHDSGFTGYMGMALPGGEVALLKDADGQDRQLLATNEPGSVSDGDIREIAITCTVDPSGNAEVVFAVNGRIQVSVDHTDASITFFTASELLLAAATDEPFFVDFSYVDAHAPHAGDPTVP
ncbi:MAG: hypothetical protein R3246_17090, partial [Acidimicrobiia bacterium]|nr:hypothetical protein [Acidimicrobiia bacterium]